MDVTLGWPPVLDRLGLGELVRFIVPRPTIIAPGPGGPIGDLRAEPRAMNITFRLGPNGLVVIADGVSLVEGVDPVRAVDTAYGHLHRVAFERAEAAGWIRVHGAVADLPAGRVVIVGAPGTGKSTLAAQLLLSGADVSGDEWLLARDGTVLAFPRRFHLDSTALDVLPGLASLWSALATMPSHDAAAGNGLRRAIDPLDLGRPWVIGPRPVTALLFLARRHHGANVIERQSSLAAVEQLLAQMFDPDTVSAPANDEAHARLTRGDVVRETCTLVNAAPCLTIAVNDLASIADTLDARIATV